MGFDFRIGSEVSQSLAKPELNTTATAATKEAEETTLTIGKEREKDGDTVAISTEAKELLEKAKSEGTKGGEAESTTSKQDELIAKIKEQIEKLKQEIEKLQQNPEENKEQISAKQNQMLQLQGQLTEMLEQKAKAAGTSSGGGTRAQGFKNSLS